MNTALARREPTGVALSSAGMSPVALGEVLAASGYFQDARQAAQAAVKVMAGDELGIGPIAAMTGIHIVQGKVTIGAALIAALIRRSGRYTYRVAEHTDDACDLVFFEGSAELGHSRFTMEDAKRANLLAKPGPWRDHPRNMLFARAISNGAKWHTPDVFAGPVYTPEELGAVVTAEGEVVSLPPAPPAPPPPPPTPREPEPAPAAAAPQDAPEFAEQKKRLDTLIEAYAEKIGAEEFGRILREELGVEKYGDVTAEKFTEANRRFARMLAEGPDPVRRNPDDDATMGAPDEPITGQTTMATA